MEDNFWRSIKEFGLPPANESVLITSGDCTIIDVAQWFHGKEGKIRWQQGGLFSDIFPEYRNAEYWMPIKKFDAHQKSKQQKNKDYTEKPPLGLMPEYIHKEKRLSEINEAIKRYEDADKEIPNEWVDEKLKLCSWLLERRRKPILFTTFDNVPIYEGDRAYRLLPSFHTMEYMEVCEANYTHQDKWFSTRDAAKQYALMNKPCLSLKEVHELYNSLINKFSPKTFEQQLKELVKSKINIT